ncbi:MAG: RusA family crossover junction endodeoxyribonuclease [Limisphaerales bacterium]
MAHIRTSIDGVPYSKTKTRGNKAAAEAWSQKVIQQTSSLSPVSDACVLRVTFRLPRDKFPPDFPYGPDLDNLLKRLMDALGHTIFAISKGGDSCVVALEAMKVPVDTRPGVDIEILPVKVA